MLDQQTRTRNLIKKAKAPTMKRNMLKLKRILMDCLLENNILEGRGQGRQPTTQFLRWGRRT